MKRLTDYYRDPLEGERAAAELDAAQRRATAQDTANRARQRHRNAALLLVIAVIVWAALFARYPFDPSDELPPGVPLRSSSGMRGMP